MSINHLDQLAEWYESAERITKTNLPRSGDYVISPFFNGTGFHVELEPDDWTADIVREEREDARILSRAPKPKPAWHDAVAVIANHRDYPDEPRTVWSRDGDPEGRDWSDHACPMAAPHHLVNVTPLIEAKVTDEMVHRAAVAFIRARDDGHVKPFTAALTAALGLEAE